MIHGILTGLSQSEEPVEKIVADDNSSSSDEEIYDDGKPRAIFYRRTRRPKRGADGKRAKVTKGVASTLGFFPNNPRHEVLPRLGHEANGLIDAVRSIFSPVPAPSYLRTALCSAAPCHTVVNIGW